MGQSFQQDNNMTSVLRDINITLSSKVIKLIETLLFDNKQGDERKQYSADNKVACVK